MELRNKLVFHIPEKAWQQDHLEDIDVDFAVGKLAQSLNNAGTDSFYTQEVIGCYKGRHYPERLMVVFCDDADKATDLADIFKRWFRESNGVLRQEAFSYELNGALFVEEL